MENCQRLLQKEQVYSSCSAPYQSVQRFIQPNKNYSHTPREILAIAAASQQINKEFQNCQNKMQQYNTEYLPTQQYIATKLTYLQSMQPTEPSTKLGDKRKDSFMSTSSEKLIKEEQLNNSDISQNSKGIKKSYIQYTPDQQKFLKNFFNKQPYPTHEQTQDIALQLNTTISRIQNWFKHNRRHLARSGKFSIKNRKFFTKEDINYLQTYFEQNHRQNIEIYAEIAEKLNCTITQIKNWFSNKQKKQKKIYKLSTNSKNDKNDQITTSDSNDTVKTSSSNIQVPQFPQQQQQQQQQQQSLNETPNQNILPPPTYLKFLNLQSNNCNQPVYYMPMNNQSIFQNIARFYHLLRNYY